MPSSNATYLKVSLYNLQVRKEFHYPFYLDPDYCEKSVPNLDGCKGHSEHIIFGSNVDLSVPSEDRTTHLTTGQAEGESKERARQQVAGSTNESAVPGGDVEKSEEKEQTETETEAAKL